MLPYGLFCPRTPELVEGGALRLPRSVVLDIYENLHRLEFDLPPIEQLGLHLDVDSFPDIDLPQGFEGKLRPYQMEGYRWMAHLDQGGTGGLLADEMGLGKTVQVIAHLARLSEGGTLRPSLVVCPKTLIDNWRDEISRFFPGHGHAGILGPRPVPPEVLAKFDVVLTSYDTLRTRQYEIARVDWKCLVSDEAQFAKNPTAQRTTALKALKAEHRVALTGTPVENGLIEFWCIMDFVRPGLLGSWSDFRTNHERKLVEAGSEEDRDPLVRQLLAELGPHYLRRLKANVLQELPEKKAEILEAPLSEQQMEAYQEIARAALAGERGDALAALSHLLMICGHPGALDGYGAEFKYIHGELTHVN